MEYSHMPHDFWGGFGNNLSQHAKNKTMVKFTWWKKAAAKKAVVMIRKVARISTSTKDVSQSRFVNE